jgi:hypothetical protein
MNQFDIYEYTDENLKKDENCLTVDFYFESDVTKDEAVNQIDLIAMLADNNDKFTFTSHRPAIFVKSPYVKDSE